MICGGRCEIVTYRSEIKPSGCIPSRATRIIRDSLKNPPAPTNLRNPTPVSRQARHGRPLTEDDCSRRRLPHAPEALKTRTQIHTGFQMYEDCEGCGLPQGNGETVISLSSR